MRKIKSPVRWHQCVKNMTDEDRTALKELLNKLCSESAASESAPDKKRQLSRHVSEDSCGFPAMLRSPTRKRTGGDAPTLFYPSDDGSAEEDIMNKTLAPPKKTGKDGVKAQLKRPAAASSSDGLKRPAAAPADHGALATSEEVVLKATINDRGSYIQARLPDGSLKHWVAISPNQSPDHKILIQKMVDAKPRSKQEALELRSVLLQ